MPAIRRLHSLSPITQIVVLTIHEDNDRVFDAICAGASGYLLKTAHARGDPAGHLEVRVK